MSAEPARGRSSAALGAGALAGALAAVPAIARLTAAGVDAGTVVAALAGGGALLLGPLLVLVQRARAGGARLSFTLAGLGLVAWPLAWFGALLESTTHHRPLGAATFAILALALVLGGLLVAWRVAALDRTGVARWPVLALYAAAAASTGLVVLGALRVDGLRAAVLDGVLLVVGGALGWVGMRRPALATPLSRFGLALWLALVAGHLLAVTRPSFDQIRVRAPVFSGPCGFL